MRGTESPATRASHHVNKCFKKDVMGDVTAEKKGLQDAGAR